MRTKQRSSSIKVLASRASSSQLHSKEVPSLNEDQNPCDQNPLRKFDNCLCHKNLQIFLPKCTCASFSADIQDDIIREMKLNLHKGLLIDLFLLLFLHPWLKLLGGWVIF